MEAETEAREQAQEVDVYKAALDVAVAELGDMPPEVIEWRRIQFRDAVQMAALTW